jgi:hypothetical protein
MRIAAAFQPRSSREGFYSCGRREVSRLEQPDELANHTPFCENQHTTFVKLNWNERNELTTS